MHILKTMKLRYMDKEVECTVFFDTGVGGSAVQRTFFEKHFGVELLRLENTSSITVEMELR